MSNLPKEVQRSIKESQALEAKLTREYSKIRKSFEKCKRDKITCEKESSKANQIRKEYQREIDREANRMNNMLRYLER